MRRILLISCAIIALAIAGLATWAVRSAPQLRGRVVVPLNARFQSQHARGAHDTQVLPKPRAAGPNQTQRHNGRTDVPPLITIDSFETSAALLDLTRTPVRLDKVAIQGLAVRMPPGGLNPGKRDEKTPHVPHAERPSPILIDRIEARSARVEIHSRRPDRLPRTWDIQNLVMRDFGAASGSPFTAGLINPVPRGVIDTTGAFGPGHPGVPGRTPVSGN